MVLSPHKMLYDRNDRADFHILARARNLGAIYLCTMYHTTNYPNELTLREKNVSLSEARLLASSSFQNVFAYIDKAC